MKKPEGIFMKRVKMEHNGFPEWGIIWWKSVDGWGRIFLRLHLGLRRITMQLKGDVL